MRHFLHRINSTIMYQYSTLTRTAEKLITYLKNNTLEQEIKNIEDVIPIMESLKKVYPQWMLVICPMKHPTARYVSDNSEQVIGLTPADLMNENGYLTFYSNVLKEDQKDLSDCLSFLQNHLTQVMSTDFASYRCIFHYRYQHKNGRVVHLVDEKAALLGMGDHIHYSLIREIAPEQPFGGVRVELYRQNGSLQKITEYRPGAQNVKLSRRETELVELLKSGLSTKEMAHRLNISHHTVRNIRQKMFEKYKVNNAIELLNKTVQYN